MTLLVCEVFNLELKFNLKSLKSFEDVSIISNVSFVLVWKKKKSITNIKRVTNINLLSVCFFFQNMNRNSITQKVLLRFKSRWL